MKEGTVEIEDQLRDALHRSMRGVEPPVHDLVAGALHRGRPPWRSATAGWAAAAAAAVAVGATALAVTTPWSDPEAGGAAAGSPTPPAGPCRSQAREELLPTWARMGFSDPAPVIMHARSDHGRIVAILFGRVLHAPPAEEVNNKILWVARSRGADPLSIEAVRDGDGRTVHREVPGGPGPSTVDLPAAGCWHLTLRWGSEPERRDTMDLEYVDPR
jgi:hypothetical protein